MAFINEWFWLCLLLPVAALSGWVIGRRGGERHSDTQVSRLSTTYFRGLNYLLNEQPDKAIELFLHIAELDKDTFETQVALGHLFRRRGEVDRAIRPHQGQRISWPVIVGSVILTHLQGFGRGVASRKARVGIVGDFGQRRLHAEIPRAHCRFCKRYTFSKFIR